MNTLAHYLARSLEATAAFVRRHPWITAAALALWVVLQLQLALAITKPLRDAVAWLWRTISAWKLSHPWLYYLAVAVAFVALPGPVILGLWLAHGAGRTESARRLNATSSVET
jgi:hypothetical protein